MFDVVVVGGGLVGCCFALDLARQNPNLQISLLEQNGFRVEGDEPGWDNKIYALTPRNFQQLTSRLGLNIDEARLGTIQRMKVRGNHNSCIEFDSSVAKANYLAKIIEYRNLHQAVLNELTKCSNIQLQTLVIQEIFESAESIRLVASKGEEIVTSLLVAADGANSLLRKKFEFDVEEIPYYQSGVVANFSCQLPHQDTAHQWFHADEGILAYLPLPEQQISMVWATDKYQQLLTLSDEALCEEVARAGNSVLGKLTLITRPMAFPLKLNLVKQFYQRRVILIGDAAHTIHPLAGQGLNLGFGDAWELARLLAKLDLSNYNSLSLARFNFSRLAEVRKMQMTCHLLQRLFHNRLSLIDRLRNKGLNLLNKLPLLKQALINSAINY